MTVSVSKQRVFVPSYGTGAQVTKQRVFVPSYGTGAQVTKQRVFVPSYDTALNPPPASARRRQAMLGSL